MKKRVLKRKIIVSYIMVGLILLILFSALVANMILKNGQATVEQNLANDNSTIYNATNVLLDSAYTSMHDSFTYDRMINKGMYFRELDHFERVEVQNSLSRMVNSNPILESIYIYNAHTGLFYSTISTPRTVETFYEPGLFDDIVGFLERDQIFWVRDIQYVDYSFNYDKQVITFIFGGYEEQVEDKSMIVVNISQEKLNKIIYGNFSHNSNTSSFIINDQGWVISNSELDKVNIDLSQEPYIKKIMTNYDGEGSFTTNVKGQDYVISYKKSGKWGTTVVSMASYDALISHVYDTVRLVGLFAVAFIAVSIVIALYFTHSIYKPIDNMVMEAESMGELITQTANNESEYIRHVIRTMKDEIGHLSDRVSSYSQVKRNNLLKQLLAGSQVLANELDECGVKLIGPAYSVLVIRIDGYKTVADNNGISSLLAGRKRLCQLISKQMSGFFTFEVVDDGLEYLPLIINISEDHISWLTEIKEVIGRIQKTYYEETGFTFNAGIGNIVFDRTGLKDSYNDGKEVTNYRIIYGNGAILTNQDYLEAKKNNYQYPIQIEKKILDSLKLRDRCGVGPLLSSFTEAVVGYEYNEILQSYSQLVLVIVREAKQYNYKANKNIRINYIEMQNRLNSCNTIESINDEIVDLLIEIMDRLDNLTITTNLELSNRVIAYVSESYGDEKLCVEKIAEEEKMSINHLRLLFKQETGISLSDHINSVRFEEAKRLLVETVFPAKKIACMCGFGNSDYFYYAFKKSTGLSPTTYRKQHQ